MRMRIAGSPATGWPSAHAAMLNILCKKKAEKAKSIGPSLFTTCCECWCWVCGMGVEWCGSEHTVVFSIERASLDAMGRSRGR